ALHMMPYLTSIGLERPNAALAVSIFAIVSIPTRILYGISADIFQKKYVMALSLGLTVVAQVILGLLDGSSFALVVVFTVVHGFAAGGAMPTRAPMIREYFGVNNFGTIYGLLGVFLMIGVVIGAPIAGWVYDTRGVYDPIWFVYAGLNIIAMILILVLPKASGKTSPVVS
ncbi:MFS transporter, partial [Chloroflexota bacterium]